MGMSATSALDGFLARLDKVKHTGPNRWVARCPAHDDRNPSLAVRELDDGRVLVHCFGGCGAAEVLAAVGMSFSDLFPEKEPDYARIEKRGTNKERRPFNPYDVLRCVGYEALLVAVSAANIRQGIELSDADYERLMLSAERLQAAVSYGTA